jgi:hypothetical protein
MAFNLLASKMAKTFMPKKCDILSQNELESVQSCLMDRIKTTFGTRLSLWSESRVVYQMAQASNLIRNFFWMSAILSFQVI